MGSTLNGLIKSLNKYDVSSDEMTMLVERLKELNSTSNFKAGECIYVPILNRHVENAPYMGPT